MKDGPSFLISFLVLVMMSPLPLGICQLDSNANAGLQCSSADNSTSETTFKANLDNLLNSLTENVALPRNDGFFKTTVGKEEIIYGLVQCRADVSAQNCANCTKQAVGEAFRECPKSKMVQVWSSWCTLRYSNEKFFGVLGPSSMATYNDTDLDDASILYKGVNFMSEVVSNTSEQPLMFNTGMFDAGRFGKTYGMAQCARDISRKDCSKCLETPLTSFRNIIGNKRGWEAYGSGCGLWYHDYQFFSNISIPANDGAGRRRSTVTTMATMILMSLYLL